MSSPADCIADLSACRVPIYIASAILIGSQLIESNGVVVMSESGDDQDLNIVIPPTATSSATYVDVPLKKIRKSSSTKSFTPVSNYALQIDLAIEGGNTFRVNAAMYPSHRLSIAFTTEDSRSSVQAALNQCKQPKSFVRDYIEQWPVPQNPLPSLVVDVSYLCNASKVPSEPLEASTPASSRHLDVQDHTFSPIGDVSEMCNMSKVHTTSTRDSMSALQSQSNLHNDAIAGSNSTSNKICDSSANSQNVMLSKSLEQDQLEGEQSNTKGSNTYDMGNSELPLPRSRKPRSPRPAVKSSRPTTLQSVDRPLSQKSYEARKMHKNRQISSPLPFKDSQISKSINRSTKITRRNSRQRKVSLVTSQSIEPPSLKPTSSTVRQNVESDNDIKSFEDELSHVEVTSIEVQAENQTKRIDKDRDLSIKRGRTGQRKVGEMTAQGPSKGSSMPASTFAGKASRTKANKPPFLARLELKADPASAKSITVNDDLWNPGILGEEENKVSKTCKKSNQSKKRTAKLAAREVPQRVAKTKANEKLEDQLKSEQMEDDEAIRSAMQKKAMALKSQTSTPPRNLEDENVNVPSTTEKAASHVRTSRSREAWEHPLPLRKASKETESSGQKVSVQRATLAALEALEGTEHSALNRSHLMQPENEQADLRKHSVTIEESAALYSDDAYVLDSFPTENVPVIVTDERTDPLNDRGKVTQNAKIETEKIERLDLPTKCKPTVKETGAEQDPCMSNGISVKGCVIPKNSGGASKTKPPENILAVKKPQDPVAVSISKVLGQDWTASHNGKPQDLHRKPKLSTTLSGIDPSDKFEKESNSKFSPTNPSGEADQAKQTHCGGLATPEQTKRRAESAILKPAKRAKRAINLDLMSYPEKKSAESDAEVLSAAPVRKPLIIHFTPSGPQNQGIAANPRLARQGSSRFADKENTIEPKTGAQEPGSDLKDNSDRRVENGDLDAAHLLTNASSHIHKVGIAHLNGSQKKITEDGSPIILHQNGRGLTYQLEASIGENAVETLAGIEPDNDGDHYMHDENQALPIALPIAKSAKAEENASRSLALMSRKQQPSSPFAPSTHTSLQEHYIQDNGDILNTRTKKAVIPSKPQDPFVAKSKSCNTSFMDKIRKATNQYVHQQGEESRESRQPMREPTKPLVRFDDDEPTLIESPPPQQSRGKMRMRPIELSSSESSSEEDSIMSSETNSAPISTDDSVSFEPHQEELYLHMCEIVKVRG